MRKIWMIAFLIAFLATGFVSCKKDNAAADETKPAVDETKSFLKDIRSDDPAEYYISGEFDGYKIYLASTHAETYPYNETSMNAIYEDKSILLDNIHLLRENDDMTAMLAIYFDKARIDSRSFPYTVPHANLDYCENVQMELINMKKLGTVAQGAPQDDFSFWGYSNSSIRVTVNSFVDDVMEGSFDGRLTTNTGSTIAVNNGKFRIKVKRVNSGKC